jgi:flagellar motor switch protein FliG
VAEITGIKKAAMLLMSLDAYSATELLKGCQPDDVQKIALELATIDASDMRDTKEESRLAQEFCGRLLKKSAQRFNVKAFLSEALTTVLGKTRASEVQAQIKAMTQSKNPFIEIRSATTDELVLALTGQHPQTVAAVLGELLPKKSQQVLALLEDELRVRSVVKMTTLETLKPEMKHRIATMISERLQEFKGEVLPEGREQTLRKLALLLSGLDMKMRDDLLGGIEDSDEEIGSMVRNLMITWEDIVKIADRSLQECMRNIEAGTLAVAFFEADEEVMTKIRTNLSERAVTMLDEEVALMQEPLENEVLAARDQIVEPLREANEAGTLRVEK